MSWFWDQIEKVSDRFRVKRIRKEYPDNVTIIDQYQDGFRAGKKDGYAQGYKDGYNAGLSESKPKNKETSKNQNQDLDGVPPPIK